MVAGARTQPVDAIYRLRVADDHGRVYLPAELRRRLFGGPTEGEVEARIEEGVLILTPVWAADDDAEARVAGR